MNAENNSRSTLMQAGLTLVVLALLVIVLGGEARASTAVTVAPPPITAVDVLSDRTTSYQPIMLNTYSAIQDTLPTAPQSCRYGVSNLGPNAATWNAVLRAGKYIDFSIFGQSSNTTRYVPIIRMKQQGATGYIIDRPGGGLASIRAMVRANPGMIWIVGNEPDTLAQDGMVPEAYANGYHDVYHTIKGADPTARVANAGLVSATPNRIEYMEKVYQAYQQQFGAPWPVDVWTMHIYILPEMGPNGEPHSQWTPALGTTGANGMRESNFNPNSCRDPYDNRYCYAEHDSLAIAETQLRNMRNWLAGKGQQNKPLMLTEWSVLYPYEVDSPTSCFVQDEFGNCFTPERVTNYMTRTLNLFETATDPATGYPYDGNRLVQNWMWFSTYSDGVGSASNLLKAGSDTASTGYDRYLTLMGQEFIAQSTRAAPQPNLYVANVFAAASGSATVRLTALVVNNGNVPLNRSFKVTFYADAAMTSAVAEQTVSVPMDGCALQQHYVSADWTPPSAGLRNYYVKVDSANNIIEANEDDNSGRGLVFSQAQSTIHVPLVRK